MTDSTPAPIVCLMGPTASGKTDLAVALVEAGPFEIISVDSALVYRGMDIGTAKPGPEVLARAPHRLIDFLDPAEPYSAARFRDDARREIEDIQRAGRIPLLVGGTMLYYRALLRGLADLPDADEAVRARLEEAAEAQGWAALHQRLATIDPPAAARIHPNDPQRIQRALEVYELTGRPLTELQREAAVRDCPWPVVRLGLMPDDRAWLHERIARRFRLMMDQGLVEEVAALRARGDLDLSTPALRAVGYRQIWEYLSGRGTLEEAVNRGIVATRQLAKRQITWMRAEPELNVIACDRPRPCEALRAILDEALPGVF
ncbi:tRNA (adenosine(37)-N6)-dimethylallyltransferase MiaA [Gammaproteobacteria bacterium AB-CW1]|uniref:tRNA dimethylallyltransferase n=1 Tax=Natronospira elongata TaxID=3110268 RepID=A0AAP6JGL3_9GAMM|nr:tRNA (adenosine(37)-N6)-dimethylallyltransferase MiaA [Gammaproteobacteria bacterium AB-CW1]